MQKHVPSTELNKVVPLSGGQAEFTRRPAALPLVRIHLLGQMRASSYRHSDVLPRGRKARAILACLCLAKGAFVSRARLAAMLWDRVPDFQARASFRQAFRELTVAFGPLANDLLLADRDTVRLDTAVCWIDAVALLSEETGADKETRSKLAELCKGELLEDLNHVSNAFDQWLLNERTAFTESLRNLLEGKLEQADKAGTQPSEREEIARRLITFDPTHERASRILMRALADRQERVQALAEYKRCREALRRAFDAEPSPETRALYEAIRMFADDDDRDATPAEKTRKEDLLKYDMPAPKRSHRRVGVMPFVPIRPAVDNNLAVSIAQEVAAALARFRWFDVVAPT